MNCENCRWYDEGLGVSLGCCRKNPPLIIPFPDGDYMSDFPEVGSEDWCGCWEEVIDDITPGNNILDAWKKLCNLSLPGRKASDRRKGR